MTTFLVIATVTNQSAKVSLYNDLYVLPIAGSNFPPLEEEKRHHDLSQIKPFIHYL